MKSLNCVALLIMVFSFLSWAQPVFATDRGKAGYEQALKYIKEKKPDFALMEFRSIVRSFPGTQYGMDALFAMGEYFYTGKMYHESVKNFSDYLRAYPDSDAAAFARAYLLRIAQKIEETDSQDEDIIEDLEMEFFSEPLFLLFSGYKETAYESAFQNNFSVSYYDGTVEIRRNNEPFFKISE